MSVLLNTSVYLALGDIDFGDQPAGTVSGPRSVTVTNTGPNTLLVSAATVTGLDSDLFITTSDDCTNVVGQSCSIQLRFVPAAQGAAVAGLTVVSDAANSPNTASLTGKWHGTAGRCPGPPGKDDSVDADEFVAAAEASVAAQGAARRGLLELAASLWGGEPLPEERYSDWALGWRERLSDLYAAVLAALADGCLERGDLIGAGLRARDLVELDSVNEGGHRRLMVAYARAGQRSQALRQFLACRRALVEQLGIEPARETTRLQQSILSGEFV